MQANVSHKNTSGPHISWFNTSASNKRAARPKLYTKSLTRDLKRTYIRPKLVRISIKPTCQMLLQKHVPTWRQGGLEFRTSDCHYKTHVCNNVRPCVFYVCRHKYLHDFHSYAGRFLSVRQKLILQANPRVRNVLSIQHVHIWICSRIKCSSIFSNRSAKFQKLVTKNYRDVLVHHTTFPNIKNEIAVIR
jgi:hypothetical protein